MASQGKEKLPQPHRGASKKNELPDEDLSPLHQAIVNKDTDVVINILAQPDCNTEVTTKSGHTPLHYAVRNEQEDIANLLLDKNCNVDAITNFGYTPLHYALDNNQERIANRLINMGCDTNAVTKYGYTALHFAATHGFVEPAKKIIARKCDINAVTKLSHEVEKPRYQTTSRKARYGMTPLHLACRSRWSHMLELLLDNGANINARAEDGKTPFMIAIIQNFCRMVELLREQGTDTKADINAAANDGKTPLMFAIIHNRSEMAKLLVELGANINVQADDGKTPLIFAIIHNQPQMVQLLIEKKADKNAEAEDGKTPLMFAILHKQFEMIELLLKEDANINTKAKDGHTPLTYAIRHDQFETVQLLVEKHADVNMKAEDDQTPLTLAVMSQRTRMVSLLIEVGADIEVETKGGCALDLAYHLPNGKRKEDIMTELLQGGAKLSNRLQQIKKLAKCRNDMQTISKCLRCKPGNKPPPWKDFKSELEGFGNSLKDLLNKRLEKAIEVEDPKHAWRLCKAGAAPFETKALETTKSRDILEMSMFSAAPEWREKLQTEDLLKTMEGSINRIHVNPTLRKNQENCYKMTSDPRGLCIIINMHYHKNPKKRRAGSLQDVFMMDQLWKGLKFQTEIYSDLTAQGCLGVLRCASKDMMLKDHDCLVVCLMGHGNREATIVDSNDRTLQIGNVIRSFSERNCPQLKDKPKVIIVQSCRSDITEPIQGRGEANHDANPWYPAEEEVTTPNEVDFFVMYATTEGHLAARDKKSGSPFIRAITKVFSEYACREHISEMATRVTTAVLKDSTHKPDASSTTAFRQCPQQVVNLCKNLYFFPEAPAINQDDSTSSPHQVSP